ncbi:hypothetical protein HDR58_08190 [bacterium]|nr:hypothetical protein [bacterium]
MSKNLGEVINNIMKENSSKKVMIITNHLQIIGTIHEYQNKCHSCHDCLVALKDVRIARLEQICTCNEDGCECNVHIYKEYDWFNVSVNSIVGFSIV